MRRHNSFESLLKKLDIKELNQCFRNDIESKGKQELLKLASEKLELNIFEYKTIYDDVSKLKDIKAIHQYIEFGTTEEDIIPLKVF